jgi:hypothetical protein
LQPAAFLLEGAASGQVDLESQDSDWHAMVKSSTNVWVRKRGTS